MNATQEATERRPAGVPPVSGLVGRLEDSIALEAAILPLSEAAKSVVRSICGRYATAATLAETAAEGR